MSIAKGLSEELRLHRRAFIGIGLKSAAAYAALSAASSLVAGCGGGEEAAAPPAEAPSAAPAAPAPSPAPAPPPAPAQAAPESGEKALVTEVAAMAATVTALQYVNQSAKADQKCSNCMFFTAAEGGVGKCQLFAQGFVKETGWCSSWTLKPPAAAS